MPENLEVREVVVTYINGKVETYHLAAENVKEKMEERMRSAETKWFRIEGKFINTDHVQSIEIL